MNDKHMRSWFVVFVVAVFLAGIGGGVILDRYLVPMSGIGRMPGPRGWAAARPSPLTGRAPAMMMRGLYRDLNLSADQRAQLDKIFDERRKRIEAIQGEVRSRFEAEQREIRQEIEKILTPDQRKRFEAWLAQEPLPGLRHGPGRGIGGPGRGLGPGRGMGRGPV